MPAAFNQQELSCDWSKYSSPAVIYSLISKEYKRNEKNPKAKEFKDASLFFICKLLISNVKKIKCADYNHEIKHDPVQFFPIVKGSPNNRAHSLIVSDNWEKKIRAKIRSELSDCCEWEDFDIDRYNEKASNN